MIKANIAYGGGLMASNYPDGDWTAAAFLLYCVVGALLVRWLYPELDYFHRFLGTIFWLPILLGIGAIFLTVAIFGSAVMLLLALLDSTCPWDFRRGTWR